MVMIWLRNKIMITVSQYQKCTVFKNHKKMQKISHSYFFVKTQWFCAVCTLTTFISRKKLQFLSCWKKFVKMQWFCAVCTLTTFISRKKLQFLFCRKTFVKTQWFCTVCTLTTIISRKKNAVFILSKKNRENEMVMRCLSLDNFHFTRFFPINFSSYVDDWVSHYLNFSEYPNI